MSGHIQMVESLVRRGHLSVGIVARGIITQGSAKRLKGSEKSNNFSDSDSEDEYRVSAVTGKEKVCNKVKVNINAVPIKFQIDSGADVNIIDEDTFVTVKRQVTLNKSNAKLFAYNSSSPLSLVGKFTATIATKKRYDVADFYVIKGSGSSGCLLGATSAVNVGILPIVSQVRSKAGATSKSTEAPLGAVTAKSTQSKPASWVNLLHRTMTFSRVLEN